MKYSRFLCIKFKIIERIFTAPTNFLAPAMSVFRRRELLAFLAGLTAFGAGVGDAWAGPSKKSTKRQQNRKSVGKPTPPTLPTTRAQPKLVVLDPGHGGKDPGALGARGTQEKKIVLTIAREVRRELLAGGRYRVLLTRNSDTFIALRQRVARAQAAKADLFLSLHADSHDNSDVRGASVYTLSEDASDREAAALAARASTPLLSAQGVRRAFLICVQDSRVIMTSSRPRSSAGPRLVSPISIREEQPPIGLVDRERKARPADRLTAAIYIHHRVGPFQRHRWPLVRIEREHRRGAKPSRRKPTHELPAALLDPEPIPPRIRRSATGQREKVRGLKTLGTHGRQDLLCIRRQSRHRKVLGLAAEDDVALVPGSPAAPPAAEPRAPPGVKRLPTICTDFRVHGPSMDPARAPDRWTCVVFALSNR